MVTSLFSFLLLVVMDAFAHNTNPYAGLIAYLVAPSFGVVGLGIFLAGMLIFKVLWKDRPDVVMPLHSDADPSTFDTRKVGAFMVLVFMMLLVAAFGSYKSYQYSDSVNFCGQTCHTVMQPEYTAYLHSPHARVSCAECHIGEGAEWYVRAKISGLHQVIAVMKGDYQRPITTPIKNLRPAQETCERCHWPQKFVGNVDKTFRHFLKGEDDPDEANKPWAIRLLLKVGGGDPTHGPVGGIHWHMNVGNKVEYVALDDQRQIIPWVRTTDPQGKVTEYRSASFKEDPSKYGIRTMDCMDCHNRPAHSFDSPDTAVDNSMAQGRIDPKIPNIKKDAVEVLKKKYNNAQEATQTIATELNAKHGNEPNIKATIDEVQKIYRENFFPDMKAGWEDYPVNIGHKQWPGCMRCHDGDHLSNDVAAPKQLSTDCKTCHVTLAQGADPDKLTPDVKFRHPGGSMGGQQCYECHNEGYADKLSAIRKAKMPGAGDSGGSSGTPSDSASSAPAGGASVAPSSPAASSSATPSGK